MWWWQGSRLQQSAGEQIGSFLPADENAAAYGNFDLRIPAWSRADYFRRQELKLTWCQKVRAAQSSNPDAKFNAVSTEEICCIWCHVRRAMNRGDVGSIQG
jgi:hypothetical protein